MEMKHSSNSSNLIKASHCFQSICNLVNTLVTKIFCSLPTLIASGLFSSVSVLEHWPDYGKSVTWLNLILSFKKIFMQYSNLLNASVALIDKPGNWFPVQRWTSWLSASLILINISSDLFRYNIVVLPVMVLKKNYFRKLGTY